MEHYNKHSLITHIKETSSNNVFQRTVKRRAPEDVIKSYTFNGFHFIDDFQYIVFQKCQFINCTFDNVFGFFLYFKKCSFNKCDLKNSRFSHGEFSWTELNFLECTFRNVEIDEGDLDNTIFERCFIQGLKMIEENLFNVHYLNCFIQNSQFQSVIYYPNGIDDIEEEANDVVFSNCEIQYCYFGTTDFRNSTFYDSTLYLCAFVNCILANETILVENKDLSPNYASLDFQTILKSDINDPMVLKNYFNIQVPDVKNKIMEISSKIEFKKVFISYSFKDQLFATQLERCLSLNGVKTFLWEKDAPGGEYLEDIMSSNVRTHDTILFIASENSLRSKACQFELSEGRKKQEETWKNVFFPIHIDNYLFEVKKNQIRPVDKADEYWNNIEELKRTNSKDFTAFANTIPWTLTNFESKVVNEIIRYLRYT